MNKTRDRDRLFSPARLFCQNPAFSVDQRDTIFIPLINQLTALSNTDQLRSEHVVRKIDEAIAQSTAHIFVTVCNGISQRSSSLGSGKMQMLNRQDPEQLYRALQEGRVGTPSHQLLFDMKEKALSLENQVGIEL